MSLYAMACAAEKEINTYRHADIDKWAKAIDPVLEAASECTIGNDCVEDIQVSDTELSIRTSYSVRCCAQNNDMTLPIIILESADPILAATKYRLERELSNTRHEFKLAQDRLA